MNDELTAAIVLITSADATNTYFGTGFIILNDESGCHILTCAHVVGDVGGSAKVMVGGKAARVIASGTAEGLDLAVLLIEKIAIKPSLKLREVGNTEQGFRTAGFQMFGQKFLIRPLEGKLGESVGLESRNKVDRDKAWDLKIDGDYTLQPGYSGSPVLDKQSGEVMAVISHRQGQGERGLAVSIEGLKRIWSGVYPEIIKGAETTSRIERAPNPFVWRRGITKAENFFNRDKEQRTLRAYLHNGENCQIVGPRRIGKTSLLRQIERVALEWDKAAIVAYMDLQNPHSFTLSSWLKHISKQFKWSSSVESLVDFAESLDDMLAKGLHPVLCVDEFEEFALRRAEFTRNFFLTLRSYGQIGLSIVTTSQKPLNELTDRSDPTSPFYNTFPILRLGAFSKEDASDFVTVSRSGVPPFTEEEKETILEFAQGHPLALQVACFHIFEAKENGEKLTAAMQRADDDMKNHLPDSW